MYRQLNVDLLAGAVVAPHSACTRLVALDADIHKIQL